MKVEKEMKVMVDEELYFNFKVLAAKSRMTMKSIVEHMMSEAIKKDKYTIKGNDRYVAPVIVKEVEAPVVVEQPVIEVWEPFNDVVVEPVVEVVEAKKQPVKRARKASVKKSEEKELLVAKEPITYNLSVFDMYDAISYGMFWLNRCDDTDKDNEDRGYDVVSYGEYEESDDYFFLEDDDEELIQPEDFFDLVDSVYINEVETLEVIENSKNSNCVNKSDGSEKLVKVEVKQDHYKDDIMVGGRVQRLFTKENKYIVIANVSYFLLYLRTDAKKKLNRKNRDESIKLFRYELDEFNNYFNIV